MADQINSIIPEIVRHTIPTSENPVIPSVEISPDKNSETIKSKDSNVVLDKPTPQIDDTLSADEANALLREVVNAPEQVAVTIGLDAQFASVIEDEILGNISSK